MKSWDLLFATVARDPLILLGLLLLGIPSIVGYFAYRQVRSLGLKADAWPWGIRDYIRLRRQQGWPIWPIHLSWLSLVVGLPILIVGVMKL